jgi:GT2 family glycosyltransferase
LFLNPDTIVAEDCFSICLQFMHAHPEAGALGVQMIDGSGRFLKESKRAYPSISTSFFKLAGLATLFPTSKIFGRYHLGHLDPAHNHEVDVLAGAFMWVRREALDAVGSFDERFFMYGEDIDLSYRIQQAGYINVYFAGTRIIHYKGESTKKQSARYVKVFYEAMILFARKHYASRSAGLFALLITLAIQVRAFGALLSRYFARIWQPLTDFAVLYAGFFAITRYWELNNKFVRAYYPPEYFYLHLPAYIAVILFFTWLSGGYDRPSRWKNLSRGAVAGSLILFSVYAFLPKTMQFSRAILGLGCTWSLVSFIAWRVAVQALSGGKFNQEENTGRRWLLVAGKQEAERISQFPSGALIAGQIAPAQAGNPDELLTCARIHEADTLVFNLGEMTAHKVIALMQQLQGKGLRFKTVPSGAGFVIGSDSKDGRGEWTGNQTPYALGQAHVKRKKRTFDILLAIAFLPLAPFLLLRENSRRLIHYLPAVLFGSRTWIGYPDTAIALPRMKPPVIHLRNIFNGLEAHPDWEQRLYENYAMQYDPARDLKIMWDAIRKG